MTKKDLKSYIWLKAYIKRLEEQEEKLKTKAEKMTTQITGMPKGNLRKDSLSAIICEMDKIQRKIDATKLKSLKKLNKIKDKIDSLDDEKEKIIIELKYIEGLSWLEICNEIEYEWAQTHRYHASALRKIINYKNDMQ